MFGTLKFLGRRTALLVLSIFLVACGGGGGSRVPNAQPEPQAEEVPEPDPPAGEEVTVTISSQQRYQEIAGFGAALPMWTSSLLFDSEVRTLVGTGDQELGLSLLRTIIRPNQQDWPRAVGNLIEAKAYGKNVKIIASPWSPPAHMKSNGSTVNGGKLLPEYYDDYARHLDEYVEYMAGSGVSIDVVSVQNEPDWHPDYESCDWTGEELRDFVRDHGNVIQADILVGESLRFDRAYTDPSLNNEAALENFELVGGHLYSAESNGNFASYPLAEEKGKQRWMTEWLIHEADGDGAPIWSGANADVWDETLDQVLASVHKSMESNWNAYIWWWARRFYSLIGDGDSEYGTERGEILKRGWAFSQYAKFVRPGHVRIGASSDQEEVYVTAYEGDDEIVVVVLNRSEEPVDINLQATTGVQGASAFVTSLADNRAPADAVLQGDQVQVPSMPARSVATILLSY